MNKATHAASVFELVIKEIVEEIVDEKLKKIENGLDKIIELTTQIYNSSYSDELINKKQACRILGVSYPTLRSLQDKGAIKPILTSTGTTRFSKKDLLDAKKTPQLRSAAKKELSEREIKNLPDSYIIRMLRKDKLVAENLRGEDIPKELIESKRLNIKIKRLIKKSN